MKLTALFLAAAFLLQSTPAEELFVYSPAKEGIYIKEYIGDDENLVIPNELDGLPVYSLARESFSHSFLVSVEIPDSVKVIGREAFYMSEELERVSLPDSLTFLDEFTFYGCQNLQSIYIPEGVNRIDKFCFSECTSLKEVTFSEGPVTICDSAFLNAGIEGRIFIPGTVEYIEENAFGGISENAEFFFLSDAPEIAENAIPDGTKIRYPEGALGFSEITGAESYKLTAGDIRFDGKLNISDSMELFSIVSKGLRLSAYQSASGDLNGDKKVNIADAMKLFQIISGVK